MIELPTLNEARQVFARLAEQRLASHSGLELTVADRAIRELTAPTLKAAQELVAWLALNEPWGACEVTISWGETVMVEARDHGHKLPQPDVSHADAEWAARVLAIPAAEWGAEVFADDGGRRLSAALRVARHNGEAGQQ